MLFDPQLSKDLEANRKQRYEQDMLGVRQTRLEMQKLADEIAAKKKEFDENKPEIKQGLLSDPDNLIARWKTLTTVISIAWSSR